jgi:hypothetical protein
MAAPGEDAGAGPGGALVLGALAAAVSLLRRPRRR